MVSAEDVLEAVRRAMGVTPNAVTVGQVYYSFRGSRRWDRSWQLMRNLLRPFVLRFWRVQVADVTAQTWYTHRAKRKHEKTRLRKPPCAHTLNLELARTKRMFWHGVAVKLIGSNPIADCDFEDAKKNRETWLTWNQVMELVRGSAFLRWPHQREMLKAWILIAVTTGMRGGEIRKLRWDRIGRDGVFVLSARETKTRRRRVVAIPPIAMGALLRVERTDSPWVFVNVRRDGRLLDLTTIRRWFRRAAEEVGLDTAVADGDVRLLPHDLRHTAASIADARGARPTAIRDFLGHKNLSTTERYLHRNAKESALAMASIMNGSVRRGARRAAQESTTPLIDRLDNEAATRVQRNREDRELRATQRRQQN